MTVSKIAVIGVLALANAFSQSQSNTTMALTADQKTRLLEIKKSAESNAAPIAQHFAAVTKRIYENMLSDAPDQQLRVQLRQEMDKDASQLLAIKGESIWAAVDILSAAQKAALKTEMAKPNAPADLIELIDKLFNH